MNRKLIRPNLTRLNESQRASVGKPENREPVKLTVIAQRNDEVKMISSPKKKMPPPAETHAETYYYRKQIDLHSPMVIVLLDGEEIEGTIEWYDIEALKINRKNLPNLLLPKRNIKYMYKVEDREAKAVGK